jgi:hypothetical protein
MHRMRRIRVYRIHPLGNADKQQDKSIDKEPTEIRSKQKLILILICWRLKRWLYKKICMVVCRQQSHTAIRQNHLTLLFTTMQSNTTMPHDKEL